MFRGLVLEDLPDRTSRPLHTRRFPPSSSVFPDQTTHHPNFSRHMVQCDTMVGENLLSERLCPRGYLFGTSVCSVEEARHVTTRGPGIRPSSSICVTLHYSLLQGEKTSLACGVLDREHDQGNRHTFITPYGSGRQHRSGTSSSTHTRRPPLLLALYSLRKLAIWIFTRLQCTFIIIKEVMNDTCWY